MSKTPILPPIRILLTASIAFALATAGCSTSTPAPDATDTPSTGRADASPQAPGRAAVQAAVDHPGDKPRTSPKTFLRPAGQPVVVRPVKPSIEAPAILPAQSPIQWTAMSAGSGTEPSEIPATSPLPLKAEPAVLAGLTQANPLAQPAPSRSEQDEVPAGAVPGELARADETSAGARPNPLRDGERPAQWRQAPVTPRIGTQSTPPETPPAKQAPSVQAAGGKPPTQSGAPSHSSKDGKEPFDPIKENGPIFEGWTKPKLALLITGREDGYLEPCGCAGLDRMKGGMNRRHALFQMLRQKGWPVVGLDVGGLAKGFGRQAELKFQILVEGMRKMGYDAITFGTSELQLPAGELVAQAAGGPGVQSPFISANVALISFDAQLTEPMLVVERGDLKIGVTGVLGASAQKQVHNKEIEMIDPQAALAKVVPELRKKANFFVLLAHATKEESVALAQAMAKQFPGFNFGLVVTAGGGAEPPAKPEMIPNTKSVLVEVGEKGMNAVVVGLFDDPKPSMRYQRVPLDSRFPASPDMKLLMTMYQDQIKDMGFAGLGIHANTPHPQSASNGSFVGSKKCESCHEISYKIWKKSGHGRAFQTLVNLDPPRNFDPECISCHVVGWHPTKYFPYVGGYLSQEKTPHLIDTGCETCHGPGSKHVDAEMGSDEALQAKYRKAVTVTKAESKDRHLCIACHDLDNSPDFDFDTYWPKVEHYENGEEGK